MHPVAYFSNSLDKTKQNWSTYTKEAFALVTATRHWYTYLAGKPFVLMSDHNPLVYLRKQMDPRGKYARWIAELEEFDYNIQYVPGVINVKADALSRLKSAASDEAPSDKFEENIYEIQLVDDGFVEQIRKEQDEDLLLKAVKNCVKDREVIQAGSFKRIQKQLRIEGGILTKSGRLVVPGTLRKTIVAKYHAIAHFGCEKLEDVISKRFYWPRMYEYVNNFVTSCKVCQQCKADKKTPKAPLVPIITPSCPLQFISIDIASFTADRDGYKYILVICDLFSKYVVIEPLKDQLASSIADALRTKWICVFGSPLYLLSDQGSNVDGETIKTLCKDFNIEKRRSSAYHSQGNGLAERSIRSIREVLRTVLLDRKITQNKWRSIISEVAFALNTTISSTTKCEPYLIIFGRYPVFPEDMQLGIEQDQGIESVSESVGNSQLKLVEIIRQVKQNTDKSVAKMIKQYNKNTKLHNYNVGDMVWLRKKCYKTGENKNLSPIRTGPWRIVEVFDNRVTFRIRMNSSNVEKVVHHNRLTPMKTRTEFDGDILVETARVPPNYDVSESDDEESEIEEEQQNNSEVSEDSEVADGHVLQRRYPQRERRQVVIPGAIPWDAIPEI